MNLGGLSTGTAPPAQAPLQLFALMPVFLGLAGLVIFWQGGDLLVSRWTPGILGVTHFLLLGAIAPAMCGGLLQLAPVLLDAPYPRAQQLALFTTVTLGSGTLAIGSGLTISLPWLLIGGAILTVTGLGTFLAATFGALKHATAKPCLLNALRIASIALLVTLGLGTILAMARAGWIVLPGHPNWVDTHLTWGLGGWAGLMIVGTGIQIIPLFHLCRAFPAWLTRTLPLAAAAMLGVATLSLLTPMLNVYSTWVLLLLLAIHLLFHLVALYRKQQRERPGRDAHLWLWQAAHLSIVGAMAGGLLGASEISIGILLLGSLLSFLIGSLLKILPFLIWLDLQQQRIKGQHLQVRLPRLREILPNPLANLIAVTLVGALLMLLGTVMLPLLARPGGGLLLACAILLGHAMIRAARLHRALSSQFQPARPGALPVERDKQEQHRLSRNPQ